MLPDISSFATLKQKYFLKMYLAVWIQFLVFGMCMVQIIFHMRHDCRLLDPQVFTSEAEGIGKC